jgi:hypothetical protein
MAGVPAEVQVGPTDTSPASVPLQAGGRRQAGRQSRAGGLVQS